MPYSYSFFEDSLEPMIVALALGGAILDVGPGAGKWGNIAKKHFPMGIDAVEIFQPYIDNFGLDKIYRNVWNANILNCQWEPGEYELVILGDVLEHLAIEDAQGLLEYIAGTGAYALIMVPYVYSQGACYDNDYETHLQDDLTEQIMLERYPGSIKIFGNERQGVFLRTAAMYGKA